MNTVVGGLVINSFGDTGIQLNSGTGVPVARVEGDYIGTDPTGTIDAGNGGNGIVVEGTNRASSPRKLQIWDIWPRTYRGPSLIL